MKKPFKKATCKKPLQVAQNYYTECPIQARKTLRYFDRFNIKLYNDYLKSII